MRLPTLLNANVGTRKASNTAVKVRDSCPTICHPSHIPHNENAATVIKFHKRCPHTHCIASRVFKKSTRCSSSSIKIIRYEKKAVSKGKRLSVRKAWNNIWDEASLSTPINKTPPPTRIKKGQKPPGIVDLISYQRMSKCFQIVLYLIHSLDSSRLFTQSIR